jgi:hypothetical protein
MRGVDLNTAIMANIEALEPWVAGVMALSFVVRMVGDFLGKRKAMAWMEAPLAAWTVALVVRLVMMGDAPVGGRSQMMLWWLLGVAVWVVALLALGQKRITRKLN